MNEYLRTNIEPLDKLFNSGVAKKSTNLIIYSKDINFEIIFEDLIFKEDNTETGTIIIATDKSPEDYIESAKKKNIDLTGKQIKWVDAYSMIKDENIKNTDNIRRVSGPIALTDIAVEVSNIAKEFYARDMKTYKILVDSLHTFLLFNNGEKLVYFLQTMISKINSSEGTSFFSIEDDVVKNNVFEKIEGLMDNVISINKERIEILKTKENIEQKHIKIRETAEGYKIFI